MVFASDISKFESLQAEAHLGLDNIGCRLTKYHYLITLEVVMACKLRLDSSPAGSNGRRASVVLYVQAVAIDNVNLACTVHRP